MARDPFELLLAGTACRVQVPILALGSNGYLLHAFTR
jgi:hypothetical protein